MRLLTSAKVCEGEGEGEVAFFSAKRWDRRNRVDNRVRDPLS